MNIDKCVSWVTGFCLAAIRPWLRLCAHRPRDWGRLRAYASAWGGAIAQCAIRPLVRGYSLALHTPRLLRLCAHRHRDWGRLRAYASAQA